MTTAITLRHLVNPRHTAAFHFACKKCNLHFSTAEHLTSHAEHTSCNEAMVWPTTVHPGSKCVTRAEAAALLAAEVAGECAHAEAKAAATSKATSTKENKKHMSSVESTKNTEVLGKRYTSSLLTCSCTVSVLLLTIFLYVLHSHY